MLNQFRMNCRIKMKKNNRDFNFSESSNRKQAVSGMFISIEEKKDLIDLQNRFLSKLIARETIVK